MLLYVVIGSVSRTLLLVQIPPTTSLRDSRRAIYGSTTNFESANFRWSLKLVEWAIICWRFVILLRDAGMLRSILHPTACGRAAFPYPAPIQRIEVQAG